MRKRVKFKRRYNLLNLSFIEKLIFIIILLLISLFLSFKYLNKKAYPIFENYAEIEIKKISNIIINKAISKQLVENADVDKLFITQKNNNNEITTVDYNAVVVNKFLSTINSTIHLYLREIEEGNIDFIELPEDVINNYEVNHKEKGIIYKLPIGVIFNNSFLANIGPKIPIKFNFLGDITSSISTKVTNYGINNALIEVNLNLKLIQKILLPFISKNIVIENSVPISIKMTQGNVPNYYLNGIENRSSLVTLPKD